MEKYFVGIDPGKTGAIGVLDENGKYINTKDFNDLQDLKYLREISFEVEMCYLELVHSMPKQGVVSTFNFGENYGWWQGVLQALGIPYVLKTPQTWQKGFEFKKLSATDKPSLLAARELFPTAPLHLKKHSGRSDALMIAYKCFLDCNEIK